VSGNLISGGSGANKVGIGSAAVWYGGPLTCTDDVGASFVGNSVDGEAGQSAPALAFEPSVGMYVADTVTLDIVGNTVRGGSGGSTGGTLRAQGPVGIHVASTGIVRVLANRIYGGDTTGQPAGSPSLRTVGVELDSATGPLLANNLIHGGNGTPNAKVQPVGVFVRSTQSPRIFDNTIFAGESGKDATLDSMAIQISDTETMQGSIINNLLLGAVTSGSTGVFVAAVPGTPKYGCTSTAIASFAANGFVGFETAPTGPHRATMLCGSSPAADIAQILVLVGSTPGNMNAFAQNFAVAKTCSPDDGAVMPLSGCAPFPACQVNEASCYMALFASWTPPDGQSELFGPDKGWSPSAMAPCRVKQGGIDLSSATGYAIKTDLFGTKRSTDTPSVGAVEAHGPCP
jgi:hypothetical protein